MTDLCERLHEGVSDNFHRIRDFRRSGHAYSGQYCTVSRLSVDDKNGPWAGGHLPHIELLGLFAFIQDPERTNYCIWET